jgi:hypothetical protein
MSEYRQLAPEVRRSHATGSLHADNDPAGGNRATLWLLRLLAFCMFFFPSSMVFEPAGAIGTVPIFLASVISALWAGSVLLSLHDPIPQRHPSRVAVATIAIATFASYAALSLGETGESTPTTRASADRWLILVLVITGVVLCTAEVLRTVDDAFVLVRALLAGASFCALVAMVQFNTGIDPVEWIKAAMPGFTDNDVYDAFQGRGALNRVSGTAFHSIELGVVSAMLLPLAIWRATFDPRGRRWLHWATCVLLVFAVAATISRSGVLGITVALAVVIPFLPKGVRQWLVLAIPAVVAILFLTIPGLMGTLGASLTAGKADPSISTRTDNIPRVERMVWERPLLGKGPGNYVPDTATHILDNQYFGAAVTMGLVGAACTFVFLTLPGLTSLHAARCATAPVLKGLAAAISAGGIVAATCSATFDSLSFPIFTMAYTVLVGAAGGVWMMVKDESRAGEASQSQQESRGAG